MKPLLSTILLNILLFQFTTLHAQTDTSFWFAAPWVNPDNTWRDDVKLHMSTLSAPTTTVRVRQPSALAPNRYDTTIVIPAYTTFDYIFWRDKLASATNFAFDSLETRPANSVVPYGLYISSSSNIGVVYDVETRAPTYLNPETFCLKGRNALGREFLCPFQTQWKNLTATNDVNGDGIITQSKQQINVVAPQPNTTLWITPRCAVIGHAANVTYSVFLPYPGSAYTVENAVQSTTVVGQNLAGTLITSDKPVGVTVTDDSVKSNSGCYDLMGDQIVPASVIGNKYIVIKGEMLNAEPEGVAIVARDNNTQLIINDGTVTTATINAGDTYYYATTQALTCITSNNYVYALHATGIGCELGEDLVPPVNCSGSNLISFSRTFSQRFALNILCSSGALSTFTLNGSTSLVPPAAFTVVPGTSTLSGGPYFGAHISFSASTLPIGSYTIGNNNGAFALAVLEGNNTTGVKYHYVSSFMNATAVKAATLSALCVNAANTVALTGTVSGASSSGIWTTANGTGAFATAYSSSTTVVSTIYTLSATDTLLSAIRFYLTSTSDCRPVSDSTTLTIHHKPVLTVSSGVTLCKNNLSPVVLSGTVTNASGALWAGGNGGIYNGSGASVTYSLSAADLSASAVIFTLASQMPLAGCANATKTLAVNLINPPVVNSGSNSVVCSKTASSVSLYGTISGITTSGIWVSTGTGAFLPSAGSSTVSYVFGASDYLSTSFMFTLTSTNNLLCASVSDVVHVFRDTSSVHISASSNPVCANQSATLTATGTPSFLWGTGSVSSVLVVSPQATTVYTVQGTSTLNCSYTATISISVKPLPAIIATASAPLICLGESLILNATGAGSYTWSAMPAYTSSVVVSPSVTTIYYVTGLNSNGCTNSASVSVSVSECTGIANQNEDLLQIYPNPAMGEFIIMSAKTISLQLINLPGQLVKTLELNEGNQHKICVDDLAGGVYFLTGFFNEKPVKRKIVIYK